MNSDSDDNSAFWKLIIGFVVLLGLITLPVVFVKNQPVGDRVKPETPPVQKVDLRAEVECRGKVLVVRNRTDFDWKDVEVEVTSTYLPQFKRSVGFIRSGATLEIPYSQFTGKKGTTLNPSRQETQNVSIWCSTPKGKGFWFGEVH